MPIASGSPHSIRAHGFILLSEMGEVTTNVDGVTGMAAVTNHAQSLGSSAGNVVIFRGLSADAEYMIDFVGSAGAAAATTVRWMTSPTATVITDTLLATAPVFAARVVGFKLIKMPPNHTRLGFYQMGSTAVTISIYRAIS